MNRLLHALIRILLDATVRRPTETHRNRNPQLSAAGFLTNRLKRPLSNEAPFIFTHLALQSEQQPVIQKAGVIDPIRIDQNGPHHPAELDQVVPVTAVAG